MKKQITKNHYRTLTRNVQLKFDESYAEKEIPANDSVRLLDQIVEEMDVRPLERALKRGGRKHCTSPVAMLKVILYAGMEREYASRRIEQSCHRDMNYIWLLNGEPAPHHRAICRFRNQVLAECGEALFYELVHKLKELGEINLEHLFVDGTKLEANANKYSFVWKKSTTKYEVRVDKKLEAALIELSAKYGIIAPSAAELHTHLRAKITTPFVHGRGKRKSELQRDVEYLEELLGKKAKYSAYQETFRGRNSFSKTDTDATFMHMKDDHIRNAQLKPGYNIQFGVEGEYITGVDVSGERSDQLTLIPLLSRMAEKGLSYGDVTCDAGYESEENYTFFEDSGTECYIKPQNYKRSKTRKFKSNMALRENMLYDELTDTYTCQNGKKFTANYVGKQKSKSGFDSEITYYECEDCIEYPHKRVAQVPKGIAKSRFQKSL